MGCQDLLDDVPGRSRKGEQQGVFSSPSDLKSFMKGVTRSSSKSYNIKDETSSESPNIPAIYCNTCAYPLLLL